MSLNTQAILNKRKRSESDPEFPCLPQRSFADVKEFADKSQKALLSVQKGLAGVEFPGETSIFLPLISSNQLQERFIVDEDDSVFVLVRKSYSLLKDEINSLNLRKCCGLYLK